MHVTVVWQVVSNCWILACFLQDGGDGKVLILRCVEHLDLGALDATVESTSMKATYYFFLPEMRSFRK